MTHPQTLAQATEPLTQDQLLGALLDLSGDLDKAQVLHDTLPTWMLKTSPELLSAIDESYSQGRRARERAARLLKKLTPLDAFCRERLKTFLAGEGFSYLDVEYDLLEIPRRTISGVSPDLGGLVISTAHVEQHSLLQAAMQNFPQERAEPDGLPRTAQIRFGPRRQVLKGLKAHEFAGYCRELDLGGAYQAYLRNVFNLPQPDEGVVALGRGYNPAVEDIGQSRCSDMNVDLHIACAKGDISESTYRLLLQVISSARPASELSHLLFDGRPLVWHGLNIRNACIWNALVFRGDSPGNALVGPVVVYMPNEPVRPVFEYPTWQDFTTYLTLKLQVTSYRNSFTRYLDESERFSFFEQFDRNKSLEPMALLPATGNLTEFFFNSCVGKLQLDAVVLAVPVAQVDEDARQQRLQNYLDAGLTLLNLAGLVVPVLGQLMMGVAVGQLLGEVFESVEDWSHHDNAQALEHLINVAQNIASMALFAAGAKVVGAARRALKNSPEFFDQMEAVKLADDRVRLWRNNKTPYRQSLELKGVPANAKGVYQAYGQSFVKVDGGFYSVAYDDQFGAWRARHPKRADAYRPLLRHNHQGGWQFTFEHAQPWDDPDYILQRLDPSLEALPTGHLQDITAITDTRLAHLQQLVRQNRTLSERFRDCVVRFRQNQKVRDLRWQMEHDAPLDRATAQAQLLALPLMKGWPQGRFFEVLDKDGNLIERYPDTAPFDYEDMSIHITEQQMRAGEIMSTALAAFDKDDKAFLLGGAVEAGAEQDVMKQRLLAALAYSHRHIYEALYQYGEVIDQTDHGLLKGHFPQLPRRLAWEIMDQASAADRLHLRQTGRVPLRVAQQARQTLDTLTEDQALLGLYLPELANEATLRVVFGLVPSLERWPATLRLQLRDASLVGRPLAEAGSDAAETRRTLVKVGENYRAFDAQGAPLGPMSQGREGLYHAICDAVPARDLLDMDVQTPSQLRFRVIAQAQKARKPVTRLVWPERAVPSELPASCVQALGTEPPEFPSALVRRVRRLYPLFDDSRIATFLQGLGTDHLSRAQAVKALEVQFEHLHRTLKVWACERVESTSAYTSADYRLSRLQALQAIERSWQYASMLPEGVIGVRLPGLMLDGMALGTLPTLPPGANFDHVQWVSLNYMELGDEVAYFLKHFKQARTVELTGNQITRLPEVLSHMPQLQVLYLDNNRLQLTEHTHAKLGNLKNLRLLNLNNNPLVDPPPINRMLELRTLALRNCRLKEMPGGLLGIPYLEHVDLRENDIVALPDWLFTAPRRVGEVINLRHNPLGQRSRELLLKYRNSVGVGMGYLEDDITRLNEQKARELWLNERLPRDSRSISTWQGLRDEPRSDGLFKLLSELGGTADSMNVREDMTRRVWRVLQAAGDDTRLRAEIFERAATPLNCDDAAAVSFSDLEVIVEIHEASQQVENGILDSKWLLRLGRGLFRLDRLERMARVHSAQHPGTDPLEVSLAYRTGLVDRFYLPGQPRHMRFSRLAGVTPQALNSAEVQVKADELSPELLSFLMDLPFWVRYLKRSFEHAFESMNEPFDQRMLDVFERSTSLADGEYRDRMDEILREQQQAERTELERLTREALQSEDASPVCTLAPL